MPSVFTKIIRGELPARFVWKDEACVAFLSINPLRPGHTLVVPRTEVDHWIDLDPGILAHIMQVSQKVGAGIQRAFRPTRVGVIIAGLEVAHVHLHVTPIDGVGDLEFSNADPDPDPRALDDAAARITSALADLGHHPG